MQTEGIAPASWWLLAHLRCTCSCCCPSLAACLPVPTPLSASAPATACCVQVQRVLLRRSLPRTASNKVMRRVLRDELMGSQSKL